MVAHRRFGKTVGCINDGVKATLKCPLNEPRFAYVAPTYSQAKDVAWGYLKRYAMCIPGTTANESELRVDFANGGRFRLYGSDNYDRMRGIYLDGVILDEYGDQDPRAWTEVLRPALSDRKGWAAFIGTPRGQNHFGELWDKAVNDPEWFTLMLKASKTGILDEQELHSARAQMTAEQFAAEYECSFAGAIVGAYFGQELERLENDGGLDGNCHDPAHKVTTVWDVGNTTAVWFFQEVRGQIRVIDYLEGNNEQPGWYADKLKAKRYTYDVHVLPDDATRAKEITTLSWQSALEQVGLQGFYILKQQTSIDNGINTAKVLLGRTTFFREGTSHGVQALRNYRRKWDEKRKTFHDTPLHDWASHAADAFRYLAIYVTTAGVSTNWARPLNYKTKSYI